jgi:ribulose-5-phosphate 4-epimerase/fuculose-1-phosphate aldolase
VTRELRELVATGCQVLDYVGQGDLIWGHVSARDPEGRGIWLKCSYLGFEEVQWEDVILVSWDGEVLEGDRPRHSEWPIHSEIMLARPDVNAVVHTHAQAPVAFGSLGVPLRPVSHEGNMFTPDVPRFTETGDLIVTRELGRSVAKAYGDNTACLLVNHGVAVGGADVQSAVMAAYFLDRACDTQLRAMSAGGWAQWSPVGEARAKRERMYTPKLVHGAWDYLVRRMRGIEPHR